MIEETVRKNLKIGKNGIIEYCSYNSPRTGSYKSGDFAGVRQLDKDRVFFYQGDVAGHGRHTLDFPELYSLLINYTLNFTRSFKVNDVAKEVNNYVLLMNNEIGKEVPIATTFFGLYDSRVALLDVCSAGHTDTLYFNDKNNPDSFEILNTGDIPFNVTDWNYRRQQIFVEKPKKNLLLTYTDGITERTNLRDEEFGEKRMIDVIKENLHLDHTSLIGKLYNSAKRFAMQKKGPERKIKPMKRYDDTSVMAMTLN